MSYVFPKYILTCEDAVEGPKETVTFHNVFETRAIKKFPAKLKFCLAIGLEYSIQYKNDGVIRVKFTDGDNKALNDEDDFKINLEPIKKNESMFSLNIIQIDGLPIEREGVYSIEVLHKNKILTRHDIVVRGE